MCAGHSPSLAKGRHIPVLAGRLELGCIELEADSLCTLNCYAAVNNEGARGREGNDVLQPLLLDVNDLRGHENEVAAGTSWHKQQLQLILVV